MAITDILAGGTMRFLSALHGAVVSGLTSIVVTFTLAVTPAFAEPAIVPTTFCDGKSSDSVVQTFHRSTLALPLRCGTVSYGFRHIIIRGHWNEGTISEIALAIARGQASPDGTIYETFDDQCHPLFQVVVNPRQIGAIGSGDVSPQGIITAYHRIGQIPTFRRSAETPSEPYACRMIVPITRR